MAAKDHGLAAVLKEAWGEQMLSDAIDFAYDQAFPPLNEARILDFIETHETETGHQPEAILINRLDHYRFLSKVPGPPSEWGRHMCLTYNAGRCDIPILVSRDLLPGEMRAIAHVPESPSVPG